jgi:hypothetical protein
MALWVAMLNFGLETYETFAFPKPDDLRDNLIEGAE